MPPSGPARPPPSPCPIVGLGASAGGLEAFRELLQRLPRDIGAAFVLVQHLAPHHPSHLADLLSRHTPLPVEEAVDGARIEANHVYVAPPRTRLRVRDGKIELGEEGAGGEDGGTIDAFFRSLARDQHELAVAVILSGTGTDGAAGALEVEQAGGLCMVQAPETARHDGMPRSAMAAGLHGPALPIPELVQTLVRHIAAVASRCQGPVALSRGGVTQIPPEVWKALRDSTGRDLSGYKPGTVARRIARRMQALEIDALSDYLDRLARDPEEPHALLDELLIGVTSFFRDAEVFAALEERVVPRLLERVKDGGEIRIWVPGCATGEEAYSLAMILREATARAGSPIRAQIFATDLDQGALDQARAGVYSRQAVQRISPERLARFFAPRDDEYAVTKELREICLFSQHHLTGDPPFSRLDLVSCRNVLIYLENELKRQVLPVFHYALKPGGLLLLGPSESVGEHDDLFAPLDAKLRIYERRDAGPRLPLRFRVAVRGAPRGAARHVPAHPPREPSMRGYEQILLRELSPPAVVVDGRGQVLHFSGPVGRFLRPPQGPPSASVVDLAREGLGVELRTALHKVAKDRAAVVQRNVGVQVEEGTAQLDLHVRPLDGVEGQFLVVFRELAPAAPGPAPSGEAGADQLRAELRSTREHLQATIEELETSNGQLKVSNEELVTVNEELQSANEELQTSQEELQSLNEELQTLNSELSAKIDELDRANSDLQNLLQSTQIAALFLGKDLAIKKFTPAATQLFRILDGDVGRPITDLAARFADAQLVADVAEVLASMRPRERHVRIPDGDAWYVLRVLPYVTTERVVDGVVITFTDVTQLKRAEGALVDGQRQTRELLEALPQLVWTCRPDGPCDYLSPQWVAYTGVPEGQQLGYGWMEQVHADDRDRLVAEWRAAVARGGRFDVEFRLRRADGAYRWFKTRAVALRDGAGAIQRWFGTNTDVDDLKRAEAQLREGERRFRAAIDSFPGVFVIYDANRRFQYVNTLALTRDLGSRRGRDLVGRRDEEVFSREVTQRYVPILELAIATGEPQSFELELPEAGQTSLVKYVPLLDQEGRVAQVLGVTLDISDRKDMENALREADRRKDDFMAVLGHELRNPLAPLRNSVQILTLAPSDTGAVARATLVMERQVNQLARLVDDLLDASRITRGKVTLRQERVDLAALARAAAEDHQSVAAERGLRLVADLPPGPVWLDGDAARLVQVVGNLLQNALKFTDRGGEVRVELVARGGRARLVVRDSGIGLDAGLLARLFEPFAQGQGPRRGGLGLGLALVKGLVELHGGKVTAESAGAGKGASFTVDLPLEAAYGADAEAPEGACRTRRVLVIDDNADAADTLADLLRLEGHVVEVAGDGPRGLAAARAFQPEVAICDIGLPEPMDGYAVARELRADPALAGAFLVALTGYALPEDQRRARDAGFDVHLAKPPALDRLRELIARRR